MAVAAQCVLEDTWVRLLALGICTMSAEFKTAVIFCAMWTYSSQKVMF